MSPNLNYELNIKTSKAVSELNSLQGKVGNLNDTFGKLKNAVAGIALTSIIGNVLRTADAIADLSESTGIAISAIEGFKKTIVSFGISSEGAEKGILKLVNSIGEAANGSAELQYLFGRVGVSLNDLATLSEQQIFDKVINGLQGVTSSSERSVIVSSLLGKEFRNLSGNTAELAARYAEARASAQANEASTKAAADAYDKLQEAAGKFTTAITVAISPLTEFIANLDSKKLQEFANEMVTLATVIAGVFVFSKTIAAFQSLIAIMAAARAGTMALGLAFSKVILLIVATGAAVYGILSVLKLLTDIDLISPIKDGITGAVNEIKKLIGFDDDLKINDTLDKTTQAADKTAASVGKVGGAVRTVTDPFKSLREQINGTAEEFARLNQQTIDSIKLNTSLIGKSQLEAETLKAQAEIAKKAADEIQKLTDQRAKLTKEQLAAGLGGAIDRQIADIRAQAEEDKAATADAIRNSETRKAAYEIEKFARQSQIDVEKQIRDIQFEMATSTMNEMEKKSAQIARDAWERATAEIKAQEAARGSLMTEAEKQKYYDAAKVKIKELTAAQEEAYRKSRDFSTGWKNAFRDYIDNATNAAKQAEKVFSKFTSGIEDLLVNFAKTGKFEWRNFVNDMLETLLRSQIQQTMANIFQSFGDGSQGGIMGMIGSLFGQGGGQQRGGSANTPLYVYDVSAGPGGAAMGGLGGAAGSQGGGLFGGIKNIFSGVSNAVSGVWDTVTKGIGGAVSGIGSIFSGGGGDSGGGFLDSISSGIGDLFDGWFANGGTIGAGKFGVVGENGPELVAGPGTVTPMSGGTNVTYNINAVDAASFKAMIARDPAFIHAVAQQGAQSIPSRR